MIERALLKVSQLNAVACAIAPIAGRALYICTGPGNGAPLVKGQGYPSQTSFHAALEGRSTS